MDDLSKITGLTDKQIEEEVGNPTLSKWKEEAKFGWDEHSSWETYSKGYIQGRLKGYLESKEKNKSTSADSSRTPLEP